MFYHEHYSWKWSMCNARTLIWENILLFASFDTYSSVHQRESNKQSEKLTKEHSYPYRLRMMVRNHSSKSQIEFDMNSRELCLLTLTRSSARAFDSWILEIFAWICERESILKYNIQKKKEKSISISRWAHCSREHFIIVAQHELAINSIWRYSKQRNIFTPKNTLQQSNSKKNNHKSFKMINSLFIKQFWLIQLWVAYSHIHTQT